MYRIQYRLLYGILPALLLAITLDGGAAAGPYVLGELVLKMQPGHTIDEINLIFGTVEVQHLVQTDVYLVNTATSADLDSLAVLIESTDAVKFCHPNYLIDPLQPVQSSLPVSDELGSGSFSDQAAATRLGLEATHEFATGANVRVAVLDGGIDHTHPALQNYAVSGYDYVDDDDDAMDMPGGPNSGHGTFVSGVVHLVAPTAEIRAYRVTNTNGESDGYLVAEAILQAVDDNCQVINLSMVTTGVHEAIAEAIAYAASHQVLVVVAAGNGHDGGTAYPASDPNAFCVAALDTADLLADFSNYGDYIDICAPGVEIYSAYLNHGYAWWGGTSFAAPFVAAQAALLLEYDSTATRQAIIDAISATAEDVYDANGEYVGQLGAGLIDPLASLIALRGGASLLPVPALYPTIQAAVDAAEFGDTILVGPGVYEESILFNAKVLYLISANGPEETTLRPAGPQQPIITMDQVQFGYAVVRGFTLTGVTGANVIDLWYSSPRIQDCVFRDNNPNGGGVCIEAENASTTITRCTFANNGGDGCIKAQINEVWPIVNITNNTFHRSRYPISVAGFDYHDGEYRVQVVNNIFSENGGRPISAGLPLTRAQYNLFWDNQADVSPAVATAMLDTVNADPQFASPIGAELYLLPTSPAVDAGDPDPMVNDPDGSRNDLGALPLAPERPVVFGMIIDGGPDGNPTSTLTPEFAWTYRDSGTAGQAAFEVEVGTDEDWSVAEMWASGVQASPVPSATYAGTPLAEFNKYVVRIRVSNGDAWTRWRTAAFNVSVASTIHIPGDFPSLQQGLDFASPDDTVLVGPGTYTENITIPGRAILLHAGAGCDSTFLQPVDTNATLVQVQFGMSSPATISGFTFLAGCLVASTGSACEIRGNRFEDWTGEAITSQGAAEIVIVGNELLVGGSGIEIEDGAGRVDSNVIIGGTGLAGIRVSTGRYSLRGNLIANSTYSRAIDAQVCYQLRIMNNTIAFNEGQGLYISQWLSSPDTTEVYNNLVAFNGDDGIWTYFNLAEGEIWTGGFNNAYGNLGPDRYGAPIAEGDTLSVNPLFVDPDVGDFSIPLGSPCVDAGNPDPIFNDPDGSRNDIGAFSAGEPTAYPVAADISFAPTDLEGYVVELIPTISWNYTDQSASSQQMYEIEVGTDQDWTAAELWASGPVASGAQTVAYAGLPLVDFHNYFVRVRVHNGVAWGSWYVDQCRIYTGHTVQVPIHHGDIQAAVEACRSFDTILVAPGTYEEVVTVKGKPLVLTSEAGATSTILQLPTGETGAVVTIEGPVNSNMVVQGFTIRGGTDNLWIVNAAPLIQHNRIETAASTGINVDGISHNLTIRDNLITGNFRGVDINVSYRTVTFENNIVSDNYGRGGVWMRSTSGLTVTSHNLFLRNASPDYVTGAGGLYLLNGTHQVYNNTFIENGDPGTGTTGGIRTNTVAASCDLRNNIIAFSHGVGVRCDDAGKATLEYNDVYGSSSSDYYGAVGGEGSIASDPLFVDPANDNFGLRPGSPCIDAGDTALAFVEIDWTRCDMGALSSAVDGNMPIVTQFGVLTGDPARLIDSLPMLTWSYEDTLGGQTAFELQVGTDFVWTDPEDWLPGPIVSSESACAYTGAPLARGVDYYARLRLFNGVTWGGWSGLLLHRNSLVPAPMNGGPISGMAPLSTPLTVHCPDDPEGDSLYFDFELYADSLYDSLLAVFTQLPGKVSPVVENLLPATTYYWRARTFDGYEYSDWSPRFSFLTVPEAGAVLLATAEETSVPCGQPISFNLVAVNDRPDTVMIMFNGFRVYSPDGAIFDSVQASWVNDQIVWSQAFNLGTVVEHHHGTAADSIGFFALGFTGPGLPPHTSAAAFRLETKIDCGETGRTICLERCLVDGSFPWLWDNPGSQSIGTISPAWGGPYCFTIEECCVGERGNVNGDDQNGNLSDVTFLINYLFLNGPPPPCFAEANINGDPSGTINLTDLTLLVNHAFATFTPLPGCDEIFVTPVARSAQAAPVTLTVAYERDTTIVSLSSPLDLLGVQLTLRGEGTGDPALSLPEPFVLFQSVTEAVMTAGILDPATGAALPATRQELLRIPGRWDILEALAVDREFREHIPLLAGADDLIPRDFELSQNYPNPFNPSTTIRFGLPAACAVKLEIFNILGQRVALLADRRFDAGYHDITWDGSSADGNLAASGVYFYRLRADSYTASRKMILLK